MRESPPTSGWNDVAISGPCRTATILPAAGPRAGSSATLASTSTPSPTASTHGARMKIACTVSSSPANSTSPSNESTWRPNALRRTVMSRPPRVSWSAVPSSIRSASRIMPAQVPNTGSPSAIRARSGSSRSKIRASLAIVVDSPPGTTSPSTEASSASRRTATGRAPRPARTCRCSRTSPWRASTPITGVGSRHAAQASGGLARCPTQGWLGCGARRRALLSAVEHPAARRTRVVSDRSSHA